MWITIHVENGKKIELSIQEIINCLLVKYRSIKPKHIDNARCFPTKFRYVFTYIKECGVAMEADYPFVTKKEDFKSTSKLYIDRYVFKNCLLINWSLFYYVLVHFSNSYFLSNIWIVYWRTVSEWNCEHSTQASHSWFNISVFSFGRSQQCK